MERQTRKEDVEKGDTSREHKKEISKREFTKNKQKDSAECICKENKAVLPTLVSLEDTAEDTVSVDGQTLRTPGKDSKTPAPDKHYLSEAIQMAPSERNNENMNISQATSNLTKCMKTYSLENFKSNVMLIFNHTKVRGFPDRESCSHDVDNLRNTFKKYNFHSDNIHVHPDLTYNKLTEVLNTFFKSTDFNVFGCVVVVVLTHGEEDGYLRAKDCSYHESELIDPILNNGIATLIKKPKIFIIQACRGEKKSKGVLVGKHTECEMDFKDKKLRMPLIKTMRKEADVLIVHSTFAGVISHGDKTKGSWLIQSLCRNIDEHADTNHFVDILTEVKNDVAINKGREMMNQETGQKEIRKQMPVVMSNLTKKLYFSRTTHL